MEEDGTIDQLLADAQALAAQQEKKNAETARSLGMGYWLACPHIRVIVGRGTPGAQDETV